MSAVTVRARRRALCSVSMSSTSPESHVFLSAFLASFFCSCRTGRASGLQFQRKPGWDRVGWCGTPRRPATDQVGSSILVVMFGGLCRIGVVSAALCCAVVACGGASESGRSGASGGSGASPADGSTGSGGAGATGGAAVGDGSAPNPDSPGSCVDCSSALGRGLMPDDPTVCASAREPMAEFLRCACNPPGPCSPDCVDYCTKPERPTEGRCSSCLGEGCHMQQTVCQAH